MGREIDEAWIEEAVERYRRIEQRAAEFERAASSVTVTVHSPDGLVEVVVSADGVIKDVRVGPLAGRTSADVSRSVRDAVTCRVRRGGVGPAETARGDVRRGTGRWRPADGRICHAHRSTGRPVRGRRRAARGRCGRAVRRRSRRRRLRCRPARPLGAVGRLLHERWSGALAVRAREAAAHGARLVDGADLLRTAAERYRDVDASARSRHDIEAQ
jgi:hypothetical protein